MSRDKGNFLSNFDRYTVVIIGIIAILFVIIDLIIDFIKLIYPSYSLSISEFTPKLILFVLGYQLISLAIERRTKIDKIQNTLDNVIENYVLTVRYLDEINQVETALESLIRNSDEYIMALGAKSRGIKYLQNIEMAIIDRDVIYYRLLDGPDITHELCVHLKKILTKPNVHIAWTIKEKFGNITVTENECVIAFPAPYKHKLSGLRLPGEKNSHRYSQYFLEAFAKCIPIKTEKAIELLCESCEPVVSNDSKTREYLLSELDDFLRESTNTTPDLL